VKQEYKIQMVDALLECPSIRDRDIRNSLIDELPDYIRNDIQRNPSNRVDVINIVNRCLDFDNGIESLTNVVRMYEGDSDHMQKVYEIIPHILGFDAVIGYDHIPALFSILPNLAGISEKDLKTFYMDSLPAGFKARPVTLWTVIKHLCNIPIQPDNTFPILVFIQQVVDNIENEDAVQKLKEWIKQAGSDLENDLGIQIKMKPDPPGTDQVVMHLFVKFIPHHDNINRKGRELYNIQIYQWKQPGSIKWIHTVEKPCMIDDVEKILDVFILSELEDDDELQAIEFFMPCELIYLDVDQWRMEEGRFWKTKFGKEYQVLTRLDRQQQYKAGKSIKIHPSLVRKWKENWAFFKKLGETFNKDSVIWICDHKIYEPEKLCDRFTCSDKGACLMIFTPREAPDNKGLGHAIIDAGIPVALCIRQHVDCTEDHEKIKNEIRGIIADNSLSDLPILIHEKRKHAEHEADIGNHLTLIWDSAERTLVKKRFQAPRHKD